VIVFFFFLRFFFEVVLRTSIILSSVAFPIYLFTLLGEKIYALYIVSVVLGIATGITWVGQGIYLTRMAAFVPNKRGIYTGTFFSIFELSIVVGEGVAGAVIKHREEENALMIALGIIACMGIMVLGFLRYFFLRIFHL